MDAVSPLHPTASPQRAWLLVIPAVLLILWSVAVPIYEAPDETWHWNYARYVHDHGTIPIYSPAQVEANSPPLYYFLIAPVAAQSEVPPLMLDESGHSLIPPRIFANSLSALGRYWPLRSARLVSVVLSLFTILFTYLGAMEVTDDTSTAALAAGIVTFLPQFTFRGMNISNDALVTALCSAATYLIVRLRRRGFRWSLALAASAVAALAFLSKTSAIFLPIPLALALLGDTTSWRRRLLRLSALLPGVLLVTPWLVRNQMLYGDPLASRIMLTVVSKLVDVKPITSPYFWTTFPHTLFMSSVGLFGQMNVPSPWAIYAFYAAVSVASLAGWIRGMGLRRVRVGTQLILLVFPIMALAVTVYINIVFTQPQGRYLFTALPAVAIIAATGLASFPLWSRACSRALLVILGLINLYTLVAVIVPAYWP